MTYEHAFHETFTFPTRSRLEYRAPYITYANAPRRALDRASRA
jgi:hypothetical protein